MIKQLSVHGCGSLMRYNNDTRRVCKMLDWLRLSDSYGMQSVFRVTVNRKNHYAFEKNSAFVKSLYKGTGHSQLPSDYFREFTI